MIYIRATRPSEWLLTLNDFSSELSLESMFVWINNWLFPEEDDDEEEEESN